VRHMKKSDLPVESINRLTELLKSDKYSDVLRNAEELLLEFPKSSVLWNIKGLAYAGLRKIHVALECYSHSILHDPNYAGAYYNMGNAYKQLEQYDDALVKYKQFINFNPRSAAAYNNMGTVYENLEQIGLAEKFYETAIELDPSFANAYFNLAGVQKRQNRVAEAIANYDKSITRNPHFVQAFNNLASAHNELGDFENAIKNYQAAISFDPNYVEAHSNLGSVLKAHGQLREALAAYETALKLRPGFSRAIEGLLELIVQVPTFHNFLNYTIIRETSCAITGSPYVLILRAIENFKLRDFKSARENLGSFQSLPQAAFANLNAKTTRFCSAYYMFLDKLLTECQILNTDKKEGPKVYHLGESHSLSFSHHHISIDDLSQRITPMITFGAKAYHFSQNRQNAYKSITKENFISLPINSTVFLSFGEIDCRADEGFIIASQKLNRPIENIIMKTVDDYVRWFDYLNQEKMHKIYFFNVPAPIYDRDLADEMNRCVSTTISIFNEALASTVKRYGHQLVDLHAITTNDLGFSNEHYHIDRVHLKPTILTEIERRA